MNRARLAAGAVPLLTCLATLGTLTAWTVTGNAGTPARITATDGRVLIPAGHDATAAFFTLRNSGTADDVLTGVTGPPGHRAMLSRDVAVGRNAHSMAMVAGVTVPARGTLTMSPTTLDVMVSPPPRLAPGDRLTFTLHFRDGPALTVEARAVRPGQ
ncbi:copper chaperone PCu(A)C [Streptomyces lunalinharesii]|uniref:Copper chaperone PCu(A)C n=1 Tax=Streptomyces lunalinharesii TaxID=333384 RepID=A0ABN3RI99_9ACTN